jgi:hypothetical protein
MNYDDLKTETDFDYRLRMGQDGDEPEPLSRFDERMIQQEYASRSTPSTGNSKYIRLSDTSGRTCAIPKPDAVLCAACQGKGRNFPRGKEHDVPMNLAKLRLGCVEEAK